MRYLSSAKRTVLGKSSPLGSLKWTEIGTALTAAKQHAAAGDLAKKAEREYRARDAAMPDVTQALRAARRERLAGGAEPVVFDRLQVR